MQAKAHRPRVSPTRLLERCLPLTTYSAVIRPVAAARAWVHSLLKGVPAPRQMPACFGLAGPLPVSRRYRQFTYENRTLLEFPDRLNRPDWLRRCEVTGIERVRQALAAGVPVVLGFVHFGPYELLRSWTRAFGLPTSMHVGGQSHIRSRRSLRQDRLALFPEVPTVFYENQLGEAVRSLKQGHPLLVALDMPAAREVVVPLAAGTRFRLPTGALRLAAGQEGELFTCVLTYLGGWRYRLHFGEPVPRELLRRGNEAAAGRHLLEQLLPVLRAHPGQCRKELLRRFHDEPATSAALEKNEELPARNVAAG